MSDENARNADDENAEWGDRGNDAERGALGE